MTPTEGIQQFCKPLGDLCTKCNRVTDKVKDAITGKVVGPLCTVEIVTPVEDVQDAPTQLVFGMDVPKKQPRRRRK